MWEETTGYGESVSRSETPVVQSAGSHVAQVFWSADRFLHREVVVGR